MKNCCLLYRVIEMGVMHKAEDLKPGRFAAPKFLSDEVAEDQKVLNRFQREGRAAFHTEARYGFNTSWLSIHPPRKKRWFTISWASRKMRPAKRASKRNFTIPNHGDCFARAVVFGMTVI